MLYWLAPPFPIPDFEEEKKKKSAAEVAATAILHLAAYNVLSVVFTPPFSPEEVKCWAFSLQ